MIVDREYIFEITKRLSFDNNIFDTNKINIAYNATFYRYRIGNDRVMGNVFSRSGREFLDNLMNSYIIE